jgi:hypothetical protein
MVVFTGAGISTSVGIKGFLFFKFKLKIFVDQQEFGQWRKRNKKTKKSILWRIIS